MEVVEKEEIVGEEVLKNIKNSLEDIYYFELEQSVIEEADTMMHEEIIFNFKEEELSEDIMKKFRLDYVLMLHQTHEYFEYCIFHDIPESLFLDAPYLLCKSVTNSFNEQEYLFALKAFSPVIILKFLRNELDFTELKKMLLVRFSSFFEPFNKVTKKLFSMFQETMTGNENDDSNNNMNEEIADIAKLFEEVVIAYTNNTDSNNGFSTNMLPLLETDIFNILGGEFIASLKSIKYFYFVTLIENFRLKYAKEEKIVSEPRLLELIKKLKEVFLVNPKFGDTSDEMGLYGTVFSTLLELLEDVNLSASDIATLIDHKYMKYKYIEDYIKKRANIKRVVDVLLPINGNFIDLIKDREHVELFLIILGNLNSIDNNYAISCRDALANITEEQQQEIITIYSNEGMYATFIYLRSLNKTKMKEKSGFLKRIFIK